MLHLKIDLQQLLVFLCGELFNRKSFSDLSCALYNKALLFLVPFSFLQLLYSFSPQHCTPPDRSCTVHSDCIARPVRRQHFVSSKCMLHKHFVWQKCMLHQHFVFSSIQDSPTFSLMQEIIRHLFKGP
jgi:hypothetical protein